MGFRLLYYFSRKNDVVLERARKLGIKCFNNINNKKDFLVKYLSKKNTNIEKLGWFYLFRK